MGKNDGLRSRELLLQRRSLNRSFLREGRSVLSLEASVPELPGAVLMNAYYRKLYHRLLSYCEHELIPALPEDSPSLCLSLDYRVTLMTPALLSLIVELQRKDLRRLPAARFAAVWSRASGFPLPLRAFFPKAPERGLRDWLRAQALERLRSGYCLYDPQQADRAGKLFSPRNFYAAEKGLILFYPPLTLGSAAEGIPEFCLPWNEAGPRLPQN